MTKLTQLSITRAKAKGLYGDGGGLYLQVSEGGAKSWLYRYQLNGATRYMGLGPLKDVGLADARAAASVAREQRRQGIDPIDARENERAAQKLATAKTTTFKAAAESYIEDHAAGWSNPKHRAQWTATLETYAYPVIGQVSVQAVDTELVLKILRPIWTKKPETASRVRGRIEAVLDAAKAQHQRTGDNPARWRGHLKTILPVRSKVRIVKHHPALPYAEMPAFMTELQAQSGVAADALALLIFTVKRTSEIILAKPEEFDLSKALWIIPAGRMKGRREHRVPLSAPALAVVRRRIGNGDPEYLFPGLKEDQALSNGAMLALLDRMGYDDITPHGFRSSFKDWATERTNYANEVSEIALAHAVSDKTEAAYRRGDLFEKRRELMSDWAVFCTTKPAKAKVVPIRA